jgi:DNA-binding response OmpR family regulator
LGLGADKFILRPIDPQELVDQVEACLKPRSPAGSHRGKGNL